MFSVFRCSNIPPTSSQSSHRQQKEEFEALLLLWKEDWPGHQLRVQVITHWLFDSMRCLPFCQDWLWRTPSRESSLFPVHHFVCSLLVLPRVINSIKGSPLDLELDRFSLSWALSTEYMSNLTQQCATQISQHWPLEQVELLKWGKAKTKWYQFIQTELVWRYEQCPSSQM